MFLIETELGSKSCSREELIRLSSIPGFVTNVELESGLLDDEILGLYPNLKPVESNKLPPWTWKRNNFEIRNIFVDAGVNLRTDRYTTRAVLKREVECTYCKNKEDHPHCSSSGSCEYLDFILNILNTTDSKYHNVIGLKYALRKILATGARKDKKYSCCIRPAQGQREDRLIDSFWSFVVNGHTVGISDYKKTMDEINSHMKFPWRNPYTDLGNQIAWKNLNEIIDSYLNGGPNWTAAIAAKHISAPTRIKMGVKNTHYFNSISRLVEIGLTEEQQADLDEYKKEPFKKARYSTSALIKGVMINPFING